MEHNKEILTQFLNGTGAINVKTKEDWNNFMQFLESETNVTWDGSKPTAMNMWSMEEEDSTIGLYNGNHDIMEYGSYGSYLREGCNVFDFRELVTTDHRWNSLEETERKDIGYSLSYQQCDEWAQAFHALGKGVEYDNFVKAYHEVRGVVGEDYLE